MVGWPKCGLCYCVTHIGIGFIDFREDDLSIAARKNTPAAVAAAFVYSFFY